MTAHAYGAFTLVPGARTVLDIGAQMARAMRLGTDGRVLALRVNDKCASGAGRFLERVARALETQLDLIRGRKLLLLRFG
jgi:activator of 2-hydroxyglutaryl-CoA dehydratase